MSRPIRMKGQGMARTINSPFFVDYPGRGGASDYRIREAIEHPSDKPLTVLQQAFLDALDTSGGIAHSSVGLRTIAHSAGYHGPAETIAFQLLAKRRLVVWRASWLTVGHDDAWADEQQERLSAERDEAVARAWKWADNGPEPENAQGIHLTALALTSNLEAVAAGRGVVSIGSLRNAAYDLTHLAGRCRIELDTAADRQDLIDYLDGDYRTHHIAAV